MEKLLKDSKGRIRSGYLVVLSFIIMFAATIAASIGSMMFGENELVRSIVFTLLYSGVTLALSYALLRIFYIGRFLKDLDCFIIKKDSFLKLLMGLVLGTVCFSLVVLPLYLTGQYRIEFTGSPAMPLLINFIFFISVGIVEEVITRGIMQHALLRFGKWPALIVISVVFGLLHIFNEGVTVAAILGVIMAGTILGMVMYATNSIMASIGFHITWNWIQGSVYGIPVSGTTSVGSVFKTTFVGTNTLLTGGEFGAEASLSCLIVLVILSFGFFLYGKNKNNYTIYDQE